MEEYYAEDFTIKLEVSYDGYLSCTVEKEIHVNILPLTVQLQAVSESYVNQTITCSAEIQGGVKPYQLTWGKKHEGDIFYFDIFEGKFYKVKGTENYYVRVSVEDKTGNIVNSDEHLVAIKEGPLVAKIIGSELVSMEKPYTWQAEVYGGTYPYQQILWLKRKMGENNFQIIQEGDEYTELVTEDFELKIGAIDAQDNMVESAVLNVDAIYNFMIADILGPTSAQKGETYQFSANLYGGQPPYTYFWHYAFNFGQKEGLETSEDGQFEINMGDYSNLTINLTIADGAQNWVKMEKVVEIEDIEMNGEDLPIKLASEDDVILVYPNPSSTELFVQHNNEIKSQVELYTQYGEKITVTPSILDLDQSTRYQFNTTTLSRGIYYLKVWVLQDDQWREIRKKVLIR